MTDAAHAARSALQRLDALLGHLNSDSPLRERVDALDAITSLLEVLEERVDQLAPQEAQRALDTIERAEVLAKSIRASLQWMRAK